MGNATGDINARFGEIGDGRNYDLPGKGNLRGLEL